MEKSLKQRAEKAHLRHLSVHQMEKLIADQATRIETLEAALDGYIKAHQEHAEVAMMLKRIDYHEVKCGCKLCETAAKALNEEITCR